MRLLLLLIYQEAPEQIVCLTKRQLCGIICHSGSAASAELCLWTGREDVGTEQHHLEKSSNNLFRMVPWHLGTYNEYNDLYKRDPKRKSGQAGSLHNGYLGMLTQ